MNRRVRALVVALLQAAIVLAVGGKLLYDRATLPRAWVETAGVDPYLPIRGRYASLRLVVTPSNPPDSGWVEERRKKVRPEAGEAGPPPAPPGEATLVTPGGGRVSFPVGRLTSTDEGLEVELLKDAEGGPDNEADVRAEAETDLFDPDAQWVLSMPVAFFLPEHVDDPTRLPPGTQLWAEVTVPEKGAPRPIRLALRPE
jgi:hypothetical protein